MTARYVAQWTGNTEIAAGWDTFDTEEAAEARCAELRLRRVKATVWDMGEEEAG